MTPLKIEEFRVGRIIKAAGIRGREYEIVQIHGIGNKENCYLKSIVGGHIFPIQTMALPKIAASVRDPEGVIA